MANIIVISTQPSSTTVDRFANATFTVTLSGSAGDATSYLTSSYQWFLSSSGAAISNATASSYTLTNAQMTDSGKKFYVTAHSASHADTINTSSAATLTVTNIYHVKNSVDFYDNRYAGYSTLGYNYTIPLILSGSRSTEQVWPHFKTKRDLVEFLNGNSTFSNVITGDGSAIAATASYSKFETSYYVPTANTTYHNLGYKYFIPLIYNGTLLAETYCPHFVEERDLYEFIHKEQDAGGSISTTIS